MSFSQIFADSRSACSCRLPRAADRFARESLWSVRHSGRARIGGTHLARKIDDVAVNDGLAHAGPD